MKSPAQIQGTRFACCRDSDGRWIVWDQWDGRLACLGGFDLKGLPQGQAFAAFNILERIYIAGRDAHSLQARPASRMQEQARV